MSAVPMLAFAILLLLVGAIIVYVRGSRRIAAILAALVAGPVCYLAVGIVIPRITGEGRFFSVPFGGLRVGDSELLLSLLAWCLAWWALLHYIAAARRRG
jgi:xanthine/uracil permease